MIRSLIVAKAKNNVIGANNDLIWDLPRDMKFFKDQTNGHPVIMGRRNYDSIPPKYRPLPNRENCIVTRKENFKAEGCLVFGSVEDALDHYKNTDQKVFVIGGGQIYKYAIENDLIDEMLITYIDQEFDGDTFFPEFDESNWNSEIIMTSDIDEKNPYAFKVKKFTRK
jgi:dihydrofolate reductase